MEIRMRQYVLLFSVFCLLLSSCSRSGTNQVKPNNAAETSPASSAPPLAPAIAPAPRRVPEPAPVAPKRAEPKRAAVKVEPPVRQAPAVTAAVTPAPEPNPLSVTVPVEPPVVLPPPPPPPPPPAPPVRAVDTRNVTIPAGTETSLRML